MQMLVLEAMQKEDQPVEQCHQVLNPSTNYAAEHGFNCISWQPEREGFNGRWRGDFLENCYRVRWMPNLFRRCLAGRPYWITQFAFDGEGRRYVIFNEKDLPKEPESGEVGLDLLRLRSLDTVAANV